VAKAQIAAGSIRHYQALDALRGLAALAIVACHLAVQAGVQGFADYGYLAVDLFFIMSGFVIANAYEQKLHISISIWQFIKIRVFRLYPAMALGLLIAILGNFYLTGSLVSLAVAVRHFLLIPSLGDHILFPLNPVLWSLFFELFINVVHALSVKWLDMRRISFLTLLFGATFLFMIWLYKSAGIGWASENFLGGFARVAWGYCAGVLIFRWMRGKNIPAISPGWSLLLAAAALYAPNIGGNAIRVLATVFFVLPSTVLLAVASRPFKRLGWLSAIAGDVSYPLYTIHFPLAVLAGAVVAPGHNIYAWGLVAATILVLALLAEKLYDAPIRRLLKTRALKQQKESMSVLRA